MSGHSKWANIQHRKNAQDARRGRVFTRLIREVTTAARIGGADPATNPRLRLAFERANAANVPKDNLERALKRASGDADGQTIEEVGYEGYAPGGVAVLVECMTDNRNRTVADVRHAFSRHGGNLGADGSVAYLFNRVGSIAVGAQANEERLLEAALEAGAEDVAHDDDGGFEVLTDPNDFEAVRDRLRAGGFALAEAEITMRPASRVELDAPTAARVLALVDTLDELEDTQQVYTNARFPAEALAER
ncbi:MAG TPA: YebC/PmpR family DNA-binding transcriptional regulator [Gammaproteobacteria bacterium]|nr:YebC/PmpR family DNA-binding transcriptional regulator [Gammaproteobacteria bacterium]